ncbi:MAG: hypothetical protein N2C14_31895, partial [Planctomycetales bacterium]
RLAQGIAAFLGRATDELRRWFVFSEKEFAARLEIPGNTNTSELLTFHLFSRKVRRDHPGNHK